MPAKNIVAAYLGFFKSSETGTRKEPCATGVVDVAYAATVSTPNVMSLVMCAHEVPFLGNFDSLSRITMLLLGTTWRTDLYQHLLQHLGVTERLGLS
ncbi:hypothetical protein WJX82_010246 [Trebouxia sp. C0006]